MKTIYITLGLFAILFIIFLLISFVNIPSPGKTTIETYILDIK